MSQFCSRSSDSDTGTFSSGMISFAAGNFQIRIFLYFIGALILLRKCKTDPVFVMLLTGVAELVARICSAHGIKQDYKFIKYPQGELIWQAQWE